MKVSSEITNKHYISDYMTCEIYLNGVKQKHAIYADDELGVVEKYKTDGAGNVVLVGDMIDSETIHGTVLIKRIKNK